MMTSGLVVIYDLVAPSPHRFPILCHYQCTHAVNDASFSCEASRTFWYSPHPGHTFPYWKPRQVEMMSDNIVCWNCFIVLIRQLLELSCSHNLSLESGLLSSCILIWIGIITDCDCLDTNQGFSQRPVHLSFGHPIMILDTFWTPQNFKI